MRLAFVLLLASPLLAVGCSHPGIDRAAEREIDVASDRARSAIVYASCPDSKLGPDCGLIIRFARTEDFRTKFRDRACQGKTSDECEAAFQRLIDAELERRYSAADWSAVARECDLSPPKCEDPAVYEQLLVGSHNRAIQGRFAEDEARINEERRRRQAEAHARDMRALGEVAYLLHDGPKCRSYPSAFGGTNTICR
jgi:hypothetical protein